MRRVLPTIAAIACGLIVLADFFIADPRLDQLGVILTEGVVILAAFALLLGLLNLLSVHVRRVATHGARHRSLSAILVIALLAALTIGLLSPASKTMEWVFDYLYYPLQSTMTALLAFFAVSAVYRAFRLRNVDAAILLVTSLLVLLTQLPFSQALSPYLPVVRHWIFAIPVTAGVRGILLGAALGTIATSLRLLLAVDRPYAKE